MGGKLTLKDFSIETQEFLRTFGIDETLDICKDFNDFLTINNIDLEQSILQVSQFDEYTLQEESIKLYKQSHEKTILGNSTQNRTWGCAQKDCHLLAS